MEPDFDTSWDIEKYRTMFESDEHWALKRDFMMAHKERFPENKLICLAQVFVNIELLRCRYPGPVMEQVSLLAKEIGKDFKESQKNRLKRTFVPAQDAANAKVKGQMASEKKPTNTKTPLNPEHLKATYSKFEKGTSSAPNIEPTYSVSSKYDRLIEKQRNKTTILSSDTSNKNCSPEKKRIQAISFSPGTSNVNIKRKKNSPISSPHYNDETRRKSYFDGRDPECKIVLKYFSYSPMDPSGMLLHSLAFSKLDGYFETQPLDNGLFRCTLSTNSGIILGSLDGPHFRIKIEAATEILKKLLPKCYVIKHLRQCSTDVEEIELSHLDNKLGDNKLGDKDKDKDNAPLESDNKGAQMLKLMGWSGGGLGKKEEGRVEPVEASQQFGRRGLGLAKGENDVSQKFIKKVKNILHEYGNSGQFSDIFFSSELSKAQRAQIHTLANMMKKRYNIAAKSFGKGNNRFLTISKKLTYQNCFNIGPDNDKYELLKPNTLTIEEIISALERKNNI